MGIRIDFSTSNGSIPMDDCRVHIQQIIYTTGQRDAQDTLVLLKNLIGSPEDSIIK
jgi:hypothetical protein